jgi:hypothetical protein
MARYDREGRCRQSIADAKSMIAANAHVEGRSIRR